MSKKVIPFKSKTKPKQKYTMSTNSLYDMNKQIITQTQKPLTEEELSAVEPKLSEWFNWIIDTYAMLLCHERRDYTVFHLYENQNPDPPAVAAKELITCIKNRGEVLAIEETEDKAWEIWIQVNNEPYCYYLFRYDDAVIEC